MNSENNKTLKPHLLTLNLSNKLDLRLGEKVIALSNLSIYYTWKNIKSSYNNNKFKISASTWNEEFTLPDGSYFVSDIQDYFEYTEWSRKMSLFFIDNNLKNNKETIKTFSLQILEVYRILFA